MKTGFNDRLLSTLLHPMLLLLTAMNIVSSKTLFNHVVLQACISSKVEYIYKGTD